METDAQWTVKNTAMGKVQMFGVVTWGITFGALKIGEYGVREDGDEGNLSGGRRGSHAMGRVPSAVEAN